MQSQVATAFTESSWLVRQQHLWRSKGNFKTAEAAWGCHSGSSFTIKQEIIIYNVSFSCVFLQSSHLQQYVLSHNQQLMLFGMFGKYLFAETMATALSLSKCTWAWITGLDDHLLLHTVLWRSHCCLEVLMYQWFYMFSYWLLVIETSFTCSHVHFQ